MDSFEALIFPQELLWKHHFKYQILRVELLAIHLELAEIDELIFELFLVLVILLAHLYLVLVLVFWFILLCVYRMAFNEIWIVEHFDDSFMTHEHRVDSESYGQLFEQRLLEMFEFFITLDDLLKLLSVILVEFGAAHHVIPQLIIAFFIADLLAVLDSTLPILISFLPLPLFISLLFPDFFAAGATVELLLALAEVGGPTLILLAATLITFGFHSRRLNFEIGK